MCFVLLGVSLSGQAQEKSVADLLSAIKANRAEQKTGPMLEAIHQVLAQDKDNLPALLVLSNYHIEKKNYGLARLILDRAAVAHKNNPSILNNYGILDLIENDERAAIGNFIAAVRAGSDYEIGASNLGSIYVKYGDYKRGLKPLEDAHTNTKSGLKNGDKLAGEIANNYAVALVALNEPKIAQRVYGNILDGDSKDPYILLNQVRLLVDILKDRKEGYRAISKLKFLTDNQKILRELEALEKRADSIK